MPPVEWSDLQMLLKQLAELHREVEQLRKHVLELEQRIARTEITDASAASPASTSPIAPVSEREVQSSPQSSIEQLRAVVEKTRESLKPSINKLEIQGPPKPPPLKKELIEALAAEEKAIAEITASAEPIVVPPADAQVSSAVPPATPGGAPIVPLIPAEGANAQSILAAEAEGLPARPAKVTAAIPELRGRVSAEAESAAASGTAQAARPQMPPVTKFQMPGALSFLQPVADWFTPPPGERFSIEEVLIRIFTVVAMIAAMFSAGYFSLWMQSRMPNGAKVALLYLAAGGLLAGGWRTRSKMARLSRPMLAGGLSLAYFTSYAGHFIPAMHAFNLGVSIALMTLTLGALIMLAEHLRSEMLAIFTVFLGYVTAYISGSSYFALVSNGGLALAAMIFLWRNRWVNIAAISVLGTYAFHLMWMTLWEHPPASPQLGFWINAGMLTGYFLIHQAGGMLSEIHQQELRQREHSRLLYMAWNAVIYWSLMMFVFFATQVYREQTEYLDFGYAAVLFGLGYYYRNQLALLARFYFGLAITLFTLGLIVALAGDARYLALTAESVLLLIAASFLDLSSLRRGALFVALVGFCILSATLMDNGSMLDANWQHPIFFRALICALVWFGAAARYPALVRKMEKIPPEAATGKAFFGGWLLTWLGGLSWLLLQAICLNHVWLFWLPLTVLVLVIAGKLLRHRAFLAWAGVYSLVQLLAGFIELAPKGTDALHWAILGILLSAAAGFYAEFTTLFTENESARKKSSLLTILPLCTAHLLYAELVLFHAQPEWILPLFWLALALAVSPVLYFKTERILRIALIPFGALSARLCWELLDGQQLFVALRLYVWQHVFSLLILAALPVFISRIAALLRKTKPAFECDELIYLLLVSPALLVPLACAQYFDPAGTIVALAMLGILAFAPVWLFGFRQYAFVGAGWLLLAHLALNFHALQHLGWSNQTYSLLLIALAALTIAQERIITFGFGKLLPDTAPADAPAKISAKKLREYLQVYFGGLFFVLVLNGLWNHPALHPQWVTVGWTVSGLAFFGLGFLLRLKFYPRVAFAILIAAIGRAFLVDTQQLTERIYQIVAFLVLSLILLAICYAFMKTKDQFEKWN